MVNFIRNYCFFRLTLKLISKNIRKIVEASMIDKIDSTDWIYFIEYMYIQIDIHIYIYLSKFDAI